MSLLGSQVFANSTTPIWQAAGSMGPPPAYGSFSSTQTQVVTQNVVLPIVFNTVDIVPAGVTCVVPSPNILINVGGVYRVLASLQCDRTMGGNGELDMWIAVNGTAVPNSATKLQINQNEELVMTVEWLVTLAIGNTVSINLFSPNIGMRALAVAAAPPVPAIPSIITTIQRIA